MQGCHNNLKTTAPVIVGTIPIMSYQPAFQTWGDVPVGTGVGWSVQSGDSSLPPSYAEISASTQGSYPPPTAPPSEPLHGPSAPPYPDIRKFVFTITYTQMVEFTLFVNKVLILLNIMFHPPMGRFQLELLNF